jgi:hypothetical protein
LSVSTAPMRTQLAPPGAQPPPGALSGLRTGRLPAIRWVNPRSCPHDRGFSMPEPRGTLPGSRVHSLTKDSLFRSSNEVRFRAGMRGRTCHPDGRTPDWPPTVGGFPLSHRAQRSDCGRNRKQREAMAKSGRRPAAPCRSTARIHFATSRAFPTRPPDSPRLLIWVMKRPKGSSPGGTLAGAGRPSYFVRPLTLPTRNSWRSPDSLRAGAIPQSWLKVPL